MILMDFTIAASNFLRPGRFLDLELQKELEFAITTIELAVIDNVGLHGRFRLWRSILRDWLDQVTKENTQRVRQIPVRPGGWRSIFLPCLWTKKIPKSDSGFQDTPKSIGLNPCEGSVHKVIFWGILRYFRKWFPCSTMLGLLNASKIIFFLNAIFEKSFKYIDYFF